MDLSLHHLFTHAGCMDGSACAILFKHAGGKKENIHYVPAGRVDSFLADQWDKRYDLAPLLFVDIAPTDPESVDYLSHRNDVVVIDHHKSSEWLSGKHGFLIDVENSACGCELFRRWLVRHHMDRFETAPFKRFTGIVDDHDRWVRKVPFAMELPKFLSFVGQKDFVERFGDVEYRFGEAKESYWTPFEADLMRLVSRRQETAFRATLNKVQVRTIRWKGADVRVGYVISDEVNNSEMLNMYLSEHPEIDVACQISFGLQKVSFRSNRIDLSEFTRQFGGGGHAAAAGHPLPDGLITQIIDRMHAESR